MIQGTPLLATMDGIGTARTMELNSSGVFTQIATQGGFQTSAGGPVAPYIGWGLDNVLVTHFDSALGRVTSTVYDLLFAELEEFQIGLTPTTSVWRSGYSPVSRLSAPWHGSGSFVSRRIRVDADGLTTGSFNATAIAGLAGVAVSPDGKKIAGFGNPDSKIAYNGSGDVSASPAVTFATYPIAATIGTWDRTSRFLILGTEGDTKFSVYRLDENNVPILTVDVEEGGKTLHSIATSPYADMLAVSWNNGGTQDTVLYRRLGSFYQKLDTFLDFGGLLDFTADGKLLVDCSKKKAYKRNDLTGVFESNDAAMVNVSSGIVGQALSDHVETPFAVTNMYQAGLDLLVSDGVDASQFKLTFATSAAPAFDIDHPTLADVLGGAEITGGGWPAGGIPLTNPSVISGGGAVTISSDTIYRPIMNTGITCRYMILHQNGIPILRHDYPSDISVAPEDRMVIEIPDSGVVSYVV